MENKTITIKLVRSLLGRTPLLWYGSFSPHTRWSNRATSPVWPC